MKTRPPTSTHSPTPEPAPDSPATTLSDTVRRALATAAADPSFADRLRRARLALDER